MKSMRYHPLHNKRPSYKTFWGVLLFGVVVLLIAFRVPLAIPGAVGSLAARIGTPIWYMQDQVGKWYEDSFALFAEKRDLTRENQELKRAYETVDLIIQENDVLTQENKRLLGLLERDEDSSRVVGFVLSRPGLTSYDTFIIDIGKQHGIIVGDVVYTGGTPLGTIDAVFARTARVRLLSSPGEMVDVLVGRDEPLVVTAEGRGGGMFELRLPQGFAIATDDLILTTGASRSIIGRVEEITSSPADPFQEVLFRYPHNIFMIDRVMVGKQSRDLNEIISSTNELS